MATNRYLTAQEAAGELGISLDTLYAYVSRGLIRSEASDGQKRSRWYPLEDVQRLKKHKGEYRHPDKVALGAMQAGTPVMESAITISRTTASTTAATMRLPWPPRTRSSKWLL